MNGAEKEPRRTTEALNHGTFEHGSGPGGLMQRIGVAGAKPMRGGLRGVSPRLLPDSPAEQTGRDAKPIRPRLRKHGWWSPS